MKTFIALDYPIQAFLIGGISISALFFPVFGFFAMIGLFFLGGWQLFSGLITAIFFRNLKRPNYMPIALSYLAFLYGVSESDYLATIELSQVLENIFFALLWFFIPFGIGIWYFLMTRADYKTLKRLEKEKPALNGLAMNCPYEDGGVNG